MAKVSKNVKQKKISPIANKQCCNPFKDHKSKFSGLRNITNDFVKKAQSANVSLPLNKKICNKCHCKVRHLVAKQQTSQNTWRETKNKQNSNVGTPKGKFNLRSKKNKPMPCTPEQLRAILSSTSLSSSAKSESSTVSEIIDGDVVKRNLNELLVSLNLPILDKKKMRYKTYKTETMAQVIEALNKYVFGDSYFMNQGDEVISQLKEKFDQVTTRRERISILSCLPETWNAYRVATEFGVSHHFAEKTKEMVLKNGILFNVSKKVGSRTILNETIDIVKEFYRSDEISRACPGLRDYVLHQENGEKKAIQRRMVLSNLVEAFELFKEKFADVKVGFSKFASLRPPECVLAMEKYGTHTTCVCCYHQNVKLIFDSMKRNGLCDDLSNYRELIDMMMCETTVQTSDCHLNSCQKCPGKREFELMLSTRMENAMIDQLAYKQWLNKDGKSAIA